LNQVTNLGGAFGGGKAHPLINAQELQRLIASLPKDNVFKAIDEVVGWLEAARNAGGLGVDQLYGMAWQLEDAVHRHLARLCRDYLHTARLSRTEEERLWSISHGFWELLADIYGRCLQGLAVKGRPAENLKAALPALCARLIGALGALLKWDRFRYGPPAEGVWQRLGQALLVAEAAGVAKRAVAMGRAGSSSPEREYQKVMIFHAASTDSLAPLEIELAERLIEYFLTGFVFTAEASHDCVYWVDLKLDQPPQRLARMPTEARPSQRFYRPGPAHAELSALLSGLEQGGQVPADIPLGGRQYQGRTLVPILRHLVAYLAPIPPQRQQDRHRVKHRMSVLGGLVYAVVAFSDEFGGRPVGLQMESWEVDNVSRGGLGAVVASVPDWLRVGALLSLRPEGGDNWLLGIVRRYFRESGSETRVGIETLARNALSVELKVRGTGSSPAIPGTPALLLENRGEPGEVRVLLPPDSFNLLESLECTIDKRRCQLSPAVLIERTADYELAHYHLSRVV
jgi:hypothetical protein